MKKLLFLVLILACFSSSLFARSSDDSDQDDFHLLFNEGVAQALVTRINVPNNNNVTNFVWEDFLVGAWFEVETVNLALIDTTFRLAAYYPVEHRFNGMPQISKQVILYGADVYWGLVLRLDYFDYLANLQISAGPHAAYLLSDEFHHLDLGVAGMIKASLPLTPKWSLLFEGMLSWDNGNFGSNRDYFVTYDFVYQYQLSAGFRYSGKQKNPRPYFVKR